MSPTSSTTTRRTGSTVLNDTGSRKKIPRWAWVVVIGVVAGLVSGLTIASLSIGETGEDDTTTTHNYITLVVFNGNGEMISENVTVSVYTRTSTYNYGVVDPAIVNQNTTLSDFTFLLNATADNINITVTEPVVSGGVTTYTRYFAILRINSTGYVKYYTELMPTSNTKQMYAMPDWIIMTFRNSTNDVVQNNTGYCTGELDVTFNFDVDGGKGFSSCFDFEHGQYLGWMLNLTFNDTVSVEEALVILNPNTYWLGVIDLDMPPSNQVTIVSQSNGITGNDYGGGTLKFDMLVNSSVEIVSYTVQYGSNPIFKIYY